MQSKNSKLISIAANVVGPQTYDINILEHRNLAFQVNYSAGAAANLEILASLDGVVFATIEEILLDIAGGVILRNSNDLSWPYLRLVIPLGANIDNIWFIGGRLDVN